MSKYIPGNQKHLTLEDCKYKECLSQSRAGINITRHELHQEDMVITPLIFQGQSPYQIITNHPELDISVRTLYSYLDKGILSARNIDLKCPVGIQVFRYLIAKRLRIAAPQQYIICVYKYPHSYIQLKSPPVTASDNSLSIFSTSSTPLTI